MLHVASKYKEACETRVRERERFTAEYQRQFGRRSRIQYPEKFRRLPIFVEWLRMEVGNEAHGPNKPAIDIIEVSKLLEIAATGYRAMYDHGMHLRIRTTEEEKVSCNSAIASSVWQ
jgi:hypothetical protein